MILNLEDRNINHRTWEEATQDRAGWRSAAHGGAAAREAERIPTAVQPRMVRKSHANRSQTAAMIPGLHCGRIFGAQISGDQMVLAEPAEEIQQKTA